MRFPIIYGQFKTGDNLKITGLINVAQVLLFGICVEMVQ